MRSADHPPQLDHAARAERAREQDVAEDARTVPTGWPPVVPDPLALLREIFEILDSPGEWEPGTIEYVAEVFTNNGFRIREPDEHPEDADLYQNAPTAGAPT